MGQSDPVFGDSVQNFFQVQKTAVALDVELVQGFGRLSSGDGTLQSVFSV